MKKMHKGNVFCTDVNVENLPKFLKDKISKQNKVEVPITDRFKDFEDLLLYFPKTHHSVQELKVFRTDAHRFDDLMERKLKVYEIYEEGHSIMERRVQIWEILRQMKECLTNQWKEMLKKEEEFKNYLLSFQEYLVSAGERFERLKNDIKENRIVRKARELQIDRLSLENSRLRNIIERMRIDEEKCTIYENFMKKVVSCKSSHFGNVNQVLDHYEILSQRKNVLTERFRRSSIQVSSWIWQMASLNVETMTELRRLTMKLYKLKTQYENAKRKTSEKENFYSYTLDRLRQKREEFLLCKDAIYSLYTTMSKTWPKDLRKDKEDFMGQLKHISMAMWSMEKVDRRSRFLVG
ncbi:uncharacterized protein LOC123319741 [Coccinella septempunctata]|uniref:uncharacterized protein LOC123319741 n=1 Tax=Coccinella septempunctata TaxID=41139 RepID=UPI001D0700DC|nr:uncharacterized protein LOC123319741 [Coccinella septempunctata]